MQVMELESNTKRMESRLTEAESKYSEMNNQIDIMQLQAAQTVTQTSADAIYDCSSLYQKNYRISGVYKLPPDDFLGSPELEVFCDMEMAGGDKFPHGCLHDTAGNDSVWTLPEMIQSRHCLE
uniref:Angiopoietin like 7 n=1 Tax=Myotis myotis TaxID=51298 RepID=A0A7J7ZTX0_MYOMY|nr:angiopoietin like 7 [Myotis myotis]